MRGICTTAMCLSTSPLRGHLQLHDQVQRLVEQLRERMRRVNRQRRQHRADLRAVILLDPGAIGLRPAPPAPGTGCRCRPAPAPARSRQQAYWSLDHAPHALGDGAERLGGGQAVHAALDHLALDLLLEAGHAHLEELVQVRADDAEELHPLQQRVLRVERLVEHALVELQPAQFAIDEMSRAESHRFCFGFHNRPQGNRRRSFGKRQSGDGRERPPETGRTTCRRRYELCAFSGDWRPPDG